MQQHWGVEIMSDGGSRPSTAQPASVVEEIRPVLQHYHEEGTVFLSGTDGIRFRISSFDPEGCIVARLDADAPTRCPFSLYAEKRALILDSGGSHPLSSLDASVAVRATILQSKRLALSADRRTVHFVQDADQAIDLLCDWLQNLRVDREDPPKLYKPALLACVFEAIQRGELTANRIEFDWVLPRFLAKINTLGQEAGEQQAAYAFYHLTRELFWMLSYVDPSSPLHDTKRSPTAVRERVRHAKLKDTFWSALQTDGAVDRILGLLGRRWFGERSVATEGPNVRPGESLADLADRLLIDEAFLKKLMDLLSDKRQVILYGPPGTGKTFIAREVARHLAGTKDHVELVQFHPSYTYEDFVEGCALSTIMCDRRSRGCHRSRLQALRRTPRRAAGLRAAWTSSPFPAGAAP
jgi:hypothetical protein